MNFAIEKSFWKLSGIYKIVNLITGKTYVGSAKNLRKRFTSHVSSLRHGKNSPHLQNAWNAYPAECFSFLLLELCSPDEMLVREQHYIDKLKTTDRAIGYNICREAGSPPLGEERGPEARRNISDAKIASNGRDFEVVDPQGVLHKGRGITRFAVERGMTYAGFRALLVGRINTYYGWRRPGFTKPPRVKRKNWPDVFRFVDGTGKLIEVPQDDFNPFCASLNATPKQIMRVWTGERQHCRGLAKHQD